MKIKIITLIIIFSVGAFSQSKNEIIKLEKVRVLKAANEYLNQQPVTITSSSSSRSAGGRHDYFSESDYWWPDPKNPGGAYIRRDGETNPGNFNEHRLAMRRFSIHVAALTSAYLITKNKKYSLHTIKHLKAWFIDDSTKMNPNLQYSQAVKGRSTGRGVGIIDAIHLLEVVKSIEVLEKRNQIEVSDLKLIKEWFSKLAEWMNSHPNGIEEREAKNNHGTCWIMQFASYSSLTGNKENIEYCNRRFKEVLLPAQMAVDGSFPLELERTKPYNYSLFNLDAMCTICQILSTDNDNLWQFSLKDGRRIKKGIEFIYPFVKDKKSWPYKPDVQYFDDYPNRQPALLFGAVAYNEKKYFELWKSFDPDPQSEEVIRNLPIRFPLLWIK